MLLWVGLAAAAAQIARGAGGLWSAKAVFILVLGAVTVVFAPRLAGWAVGVAWFVLLALPSLIIIRLVDRMALTQRFGLARAGAVAVRILHPDRSWLGQPTLFRALRLAQLGAIDQAIALLDGLAATPALLKDTAMTGRMHLRRLQDRLDLWLAETPLESDPSAVGVVLRLRALALLGHTDDLVAFCAEHGQTLRAMQGPLPATWANGLAWLWIGTGQVAPLQRLLAGPLRLLRPQIRQFFVTFARLRSGTPMAELQGDLVRLTESSDRDLACAARRVLDHPLARADLKASHRPVLAAAEAELDAYLAAQAGQPRLLACPATLILIALNVAMFAVEMLRGSSEDTRNLMALGALWSPYILIRGEWWRVLAALFLHLGWLHLTLNMLALAVFGRLTEHALGWRRMLLIYGISGLGSMAGLVLLMRAGVMHQEVVVGASGAIMGLFGALLATAVAGWWRERSEAARQRLVLIAVLIALQSAGDIATPQVSFAGHALGIVLGLVVGLVVGRQATAPTIATPPPPRAVAARATMPRRSAMGGGLAIGVAIAAALAYPQRLQKALAQNAAVAGPPKLTARTVVGIRHLQYRFFGEIEGGAPSVDPRKPFGSDEPLADLSRATGLTSPDALSRLYLDVMAALPRFCAEAYLAPAVYPMGGRMEMISAAQIRLIRLLRWDVPDEDEEVEADPQTGAWPVTSGDFKRPYGDLSFFELDMAQALGITLLRDPQGNVIPNQPLLGQLDALHRSMAEALQVFVRFATWP